VTTMFELLTIVGFAIAGNILYMFKKG